MNHTPLLYETHLHTPLCKHATGDPEEYAAVAEKRGLKGIIVTCHNPMKIGWFDGRMSLEQLDDYVNLVARARQTWQGRVDVRLGLECDYVPGQEDWLTELLPKANFDYVLGSVHPFFSKYLALYRNGDLVAFQRTYFDHLAQAAETGLFDALAHPDVVKIVEPAEWRLDRLWDTIHSVLDRIAATGVAMELNTSGLFKPLSEMNPGRPILAEMRRRQIPVVVGADAHEPERVADHFKEALETLQEVGYTEVSLFLNRQRLTLDIETARRSLR